MAAVAVVALVVATVGVRVLTRGPSPALYSLVNGHVGAGQAGLSPGMLLSEGDIPLCVDSAGTATITSVELVRPTGGLRIVAFGIRTIPLGVTPNGEALGDLTVLGLTPQQVRQREVTNVCSGQSRQNVGLSGDAPPGTLEARVELDITLVGVTLPAAAEGLLIHYESGGRASTDGSPFSFALCAGTALSRCAPPGR